MSIEDEIRRIVNKELDRRLQEELNRRLQEESERSLWEGKWDFNEIAMPEPEVPWKERHDRKTYVSETPYGDAGVTTVPNNRCRWCNKPIAPDGFFWYHLESRVAGCEGFNRIAEPKGGA